MRVSRFFLLVAVFLAVAGCQGQVAGISQSSAVAYGHPVAPFVHQTGNGETYETFAVPTASSSNVFMTVGPDRNIWFGEERGNNIARVTMSGTITEFPIPTSGSLPLFVAKGLHNSVWFTETLKNKVGRVTTSGTFTEYTLPTGTSFPGGIIEGPDHNMWFTAGSNIVGNISAAGVFTVLHTPNTQSFPFQIIVGSDGALWFVEGDPADAIGRVTTSGTFTEYPTPSRNTASLYITAASDGNLYFTEPSVNKIGRITTSGVITEFSVPQTDSKPAGIAEAPGHVLWFNETTQDQFGRFDLKTSTFLTPLLPPGHDATNSVLGPDGNEWFTQANANSIGVRVFAKLRVSPTSLTFSGTGQMQTVTASETRSHATLSASSSNPSVATVQAGMTSGTFVVTSHAVGSCTVTISDTSGNSVNVGVSVS